MSFSPASILARLDELKKWQEKQQNRLMQQHHSRLKQNEESSTLLINEVTNKNEVKVDAPQEHSPEKVASWRGSQIDAPTKTFKLELEDRLVSEPHMNSVKPKCILKKPFLKKGEGFARYKMNFGDHNISKIKTQRQKKIKPNLQQKDDSNNTKISVTPLGRPNINFEPKVKWLNVKSKENVPIEVEDTNILSNTNLNDLEGNNKINSISSARENIIKEIRMFALQKSDKNKTSSPKHVHEENDGIEIYSNKNAPDGELTMYEKALEKELLVFEALEQKAMNSSFSSTNSSVVRLLSSTPSKSKKVTNLVEQFKVQELPEENETDKKCREQNVNNNQDLISFDENNLEIIEGNKRPTVKTEQQSFSSDHNEISIKSADLRSLLERFIPKLQENNPSFFNDLDCETDSRNVFKKYFFNDFSSDSSIISCKSNVESEQNEDELVQALNTNDKGFDSNKEDETVRNVVHDCQECIRRKQKIFSNVEVMTDENNGDIEEKNYQKQEEVLMKKLQTLDAEIDKFRKENAKIATIKKEIDLEQLSIQKEHRELRKKYEEERIQMKQELEEEKKKLAKDKMVFERYVKDSQNKPSKKERAEITFLKGEITNLKETLNLKETKNGLTQARLRNQIKRLERENLEFKEQIENLQKQNARMQAAQKICRPSDTKMLHEINKNISKLTLISKKNTRRKSFTSIAKSCSEESDDSEFQETNCKNSNPGIKKRTKSLTELDGYSKSKLKNTKENRSKKFGNNQRHKQTFDSDEHSSEDSMEEFIEKQKNVKQRTVTPSNSSEEKLNRHNFNEKVKNQWNHSNKENVNVLNLVGGDERFNVSTEFKDIEKQYEKLFGTGTTETTIMTRNNLEHTIETDRTERILSDGSKEIKYPNGNIKIISKDGNLIVVNYYNGDIKEINLLVGTIRYYYKDNRIWHTTYPDGSELLEFPNGQIEKRFKDGSHEVKYVDGTVRSIDANSTETIKYSDGTVVTTTNCGEKVIELPTGEKEIHTKEHKRRDYPDGTVKIVFADGSQETRYSNGRIRVKDKHGNLVMDSNEVGKIS